MKSLFAVALLILASCSEPKQPLAEIPTYQTLHRENLKGSFFHFDHRGKLYIACSIHQGGNSPNTKLIRNGSSDFALIKKTIHQQADLRVLTFTSETIGSEQALPYRPHSSVQIGDPVVILNRGQKIHAKIAQLPNKKNHCHMIKSTQHVSAGGMSGSPIFSPLSGTVIGVLQTANSKTTANLFGFELLIMP